MMHALLSHKGAPTATFYTILTLLKSDKNESPVALKTGILDATECFECWN